jgi:Fe2+ or Zn2+ uptake regulation protein
VTPTAGFEEQVAGAVGRITAAEGFQPHGHRLDIIGLCAACQQEQVAASRRESGGQAS